MEGKGQSEPSTRRCVQEIDRITSEGEAQAKGGVLNSQYPNGEALCYEPLDDKGRCHIHGAQWTYIGGRE